MEWTEINRKFYFQIQLKLYQAKQISKQTKEEKKIENSDSAHG